MLPQRTVRISKAYALENGYQNSNYVNAEYNLQLPLTPAPAISLAAGYYPSAQKVTISDSNAAATIYYTTNGSLPERDLERVQRPGHGICFRDPGGNRHRTWVCTELGDVGPVLHRHYCGFVALHRRRKRFERLQRRWRTGDAGTIGLTRPGWPGTVRETCTSATKATMWCVKSRRERGPSAPLPERERLAVPVMAGPQPARSSSCRVRLQWTKTATCLLPIKAADWCGS